MIASPTFAERVTFAPYILFVLSFFGIFNLINLSDKLKYFIKILFILYFLILSIPSIYETSILVKQYYDEWTNRDNFITSEKALGKSNIQVPNFTTSLNNKMYGGDISTSISYNHNGSMAMYYGLNTIRIKKNFYIDFTFCNLCQEDNYDSFTLSNTVENSTESISILPEYVLNNQAPYKKQKYSTVKGNITLYYGINNLENLKLYINTKNDHISLSSIHIYNYQNLDYTLSASEIQNKIKTFHNLKLDCGMNSIIFSQFGENPYIEFDF